MNTSDFLSTYPNYYLDSVNILHKCNDNCEECYEGTFFDSVGREHHRCTKCSRDKVIAIDGDLKDNCVESCEDIGMYSKGQSYECVEFCDKYNLYLIESTKEFIVTTLENKMGIMSYNATTKISPEYDNIKQIDNYLKDIKIISKEFNNDITYVIDIDKNNKQLINSLNKISQLKILKEILIKKEKNSFL